MSSCLLFRGLSVLGTTNKMTSYQEHQQRIGDQVNEDPGLYRDQHRLAPIASPDPGCLAGTPHQFAGARLVKSTLSEINGGIAQYPTLTIAPMFDTTFDLVNIRSVNNNFSSAREAHTQPEDHQLRDEEPWRQAVI